MQQLTDRERMIYVAHGRLLSGVLHSISSGQFTFPEHLKTEEGYISLWLQWSEEHKDNPEIINCVNELSKEISEKKDNG